MRFLRLLILFCLLLIAALVWGVAAYETTYAERIHEGVSAFDVPLGGLTRTEARAALHAQFANAPLAQSVTLRDGAQRYMLRWAELGIRIDEDALLNTAFAVGREHDWFANARTQFDTLWHGRNVNSWLALDEGAAQVALKKLARHIDHAPRDATVTLIGLQVVAEPALNGRALDVDATIERIKATVLSQPSPVNRPISHPEIELIINTLSPIARDASAAAAQLRAMVSSPLRLTLSESVWTETGKATPGLALALVPQERVWIMDTALIASLLTTRQVNSNDGKVVVNVTLDDTKLTAFLDDIAAQIERKPRDARFYFNEQTKQLIPLAASQNGLSLDVPAMLQRIKAHIGGENRVVPLALKVGKPTIALEDAEKFNIKELVATGASSFKGSSPERLQNIIVATNQFHGIVVAPGQEFSFNQYLGDVVDANGYADGYVIVGDRTDVGIGGGVCQVSTTVFRAAFFGGYRITHRWAHGYTVSWYEPPIGLDATVFAPSVDFRFVNDTPNYLLIQPVLDLKNATLTFKFFGTKNNRTVEMEGPIITNIIKPGPDIRENDPTLKAGVVKQTDFAHDGKTVTIQRVVKEGDKVLRRDSFVSKYRPWPARFLVGTKKS